VLKAEHRIETASTDRNGDVDCPPLDGAWTPGEEFNPSPANTMNWYPAVFIDTMLEITE